MKFSIQKLPKAQMEIFFEIPTEEFSRYFETAVLKLGEDLKIEGFRQGKAPKEIIEKEISEDKILEEAVNIAVKESYARTILENKIEVIGFPEIQIMKIAQNNPLEFKAKIQLTPEIILPDYKKIASEVKKGEVKIEEKEIEESLKWLQKSRAKLTLKQEPCQKGDFVEINYSSPQIELGKGFEDKFILGEGHFVSGFEEKLEGMKINEGKEFSLDFPLSKDSNLAGKTVNFKVKMKNIQKVDLPEITEDWAKSLGNFESLESLKNNIREGISREKEVEAVQKRRAEILEKIADFISLGIPEILITAQTTRMLENLKDNVKSQFQMSFEDYLAKVHQSEQEIKDSFSKEAEKWVKNSLILREIAKKENIQVEEKEIEEKINGFFKKYSDIKTAQKEVDPESLKSYYEDVTRQEKVFQLLEKL